MGQGAALRAALTVRLQQGGLARLLPDGNHDSGRTRISTAPPRMEPARYVPGARDTSPDMQVGGVARGGRDGGGRFPLQAPLSLHNLLTDSEAERSRPSFSRTHGDSPYTCERDRQSDENALRNRWGVAPFPVRRAPQPGTRTIRSSRGSLPTDSEERFALSVSLALMGTRGVGARETEIRGRAAPPC